MEINNLPHIAARVFGSPLAILPEKLSTIIEVLKPKLMGMKIEPGATVITVDEKRSESLYQISNGVAIIPVQGTLVQRSSWLDAFSGLTSYEALRNQLDAAIDDAAVSAILFDIDSPGGEVSGLFDLVDRISAARSEKPIYSICNEFAASAAYAIASASEKIFVTKTATAGSIGVIAAHINQSGYDQKVGVEYTMIFSGAHKNDLNPHAPLTDSARATFQEYIDSFYAVFVETVAKNRNIPVSKIRETEARVFMGKENVTQGLADEVATFEEVLTELSINSSGARSNATGHTKKEKIMTKTEKAKSEATEAPEKESDDAPEKEESTEAKETNEEAEETSEAAATVARLKERTRCLGIFKTAAKLQYPVDLTQDLIQKGVSLSSAKDAIIDYAHENSPVSSIVSPSKTSTESQKVDSNLPVEDRCKAEWDKSADIRKEFSSIAAFTAFKKAEEAGKARILSK